MSTISEIRHAAATLPARQQKSLMEFLARRLSIARGAAVNRRKGLKAAARPPLDGLPSDLSVNTKQKVRTLIAKRHAADR